MLWVAGCIALRCTVAPGRVVCHAWFVFWVRHVLSSRVVFQHVPPASVFCGCVWYEAGLRSCHFMSRTCRVMHHVMTCPVMSCHVTSRHVSACHVMSCHVRSCHVMSRHVMSCHVMSRYVTSCPVISAPVMFGSASGILSRPFFFCHVTSSCKRQ